MAFDGELIGDDLPITGRRIVDPGLPCPEWQPSEGEALPPKVLRRIDVELCLLCAMARLKSIGTTFTAEELRAATNRTLKITADDGSYHVITNGMGS